MAITHFRMTNHFRELRRRRGMSIGELAGAVGVSRQAIYNIDKGTIPSLPLALRLAEVLEVPVEKLFTPRKSPPRNSASGRSAAPAK